MISRYKLFLVLAIGISCINAQTNLFINGGFSSIPSGTVSFAAPGVTLYNWTAINGGTSGGCEAAFINNSGGIAFSCVDLQPNSSGGNPTCNASANLDVGIQQSVTTTIGKAYKICFNAKNVGSIIAGGSSANTHVRVRINNTGFSDINVGEIATLPTNTNQLPRYCLTFTASTASTTIDFISKANYRTFLLLDSLSVYVNDEICNNGIDDDGDGFIDNADTDCQDNDGDGVTNGQEVNDNTNPSDTCSFKISSIIIANMSPAAKIKDCDGDGVTNIKELDPNNDGILGPNNTDPNNSCDFKASDTTLPKSSAWNTKDCDGDGVTNLQEMIDMTLFLDTCSFKSSSIILNNMVAKARLKDCDGDGVTNIKELDPNSDGILGPNGTDPILPCDYNAADTTVAKSTIWKNADCDGDGVKNGQEQIDNTDPKNPCKLKQSSVTLIATSTTDCDGDGVSNKDEINGPDGNPLTNDGTNSLDSCSYHIYQITLPITTTVDCDGDGVTDKNELGGIDGDPMTLTDNTNPKDDCSYNKSQITKTILTNRDCDGDGVTNRDEIYGPDGNINTNDGTDHNNPCDLNQGQVTVIATSTGDCDGDGISNKDEINGKDGNPLNITDNTNPKDVCSFDSTLFLLSNATQKWKDEDCDGDGVTNAQEVDANNDGIKDATSTNPSDPCSFKKADQIIANITFNYKNADCDGDGVSNWREIDPNNDGIPGPNGTDPYNPCEFNKLDQNAAVISAFWKMSDCDNDGNPNGTDPNINKPVANDDVASASINNPKLINILTNDDFLPNDSNSIVKLNGTASGISVFDSVTGILTYTPTANEAGMNVTINYLVCHFNVCDTALVTISVAPITKTYPDINVTYLGIPVTGNLSTNDQVITGSTYGSPIAIQGNPSIDKPIVTTAGKYNFTAFKSGTYRFDIPICPQNSSTNCPKELLTIVVLDNASVTNNPAVNTDIAMTKANTPVIIHSLANDKSGNLTTKLLANTVIIFNQPKNGTASTDPLTGKITYTPNAGFIGKDTLTYKVCDDALPPNCGTANQIIEIRSLISPNSTSAADDYNSGKLNETITGNVMINDIDPEKNKLTITPQTLTAPNKGTLTLNADGNYTYIPLTDSSGPVEFTYTICDNGIPAACTKATLHLVIKPADILSDVPNYFSPNNDGINDFFEIPATILVKFPNLKVSIYNRWGNIVWRSKGTYGRRIYQNTWHGQFEGSADRVPEGVYFYFIELDDQFKTTKAGYVELMTN